MKIPSSFFSFSFVLLHVSLALGQFPNAQDPLTPDTWPPGPGQLLVPQQPNDELTSMLNEIDPARIEAIINKLVSFGTRSTLSNQTDPVRGIGAARDWIASQMQEFAATSNGRMTVDVPSYLQTATGSITSDTIISNVVATLKGSQEPNRIYVVSGHYDSRNTNNSDGINDAPGADDDGSGTAISMELARIMATHDTKATIMFACVAGEEQGLFGSNFMAEQLKAAGADVQGMLDNDIVGSSKGSTGPAGDTNSIVDPFNIRMFVQGVPTDVETLAQIQSRVSIGAENDSPARQLGRFAAEVGTNSVTNMTVQTVWRPDRFLRGGDHESFLKQGFPAVRFTEPNEDFAHQHQDVRVVDGVQFGDLSEFCDFEFNARVGKVNGAVLWSLAQAPGTPQNVAMDTSVLTNNSTLTWDSVPNAASYEIVWRASDVAQWTHVIPVGNVTKTTVLLSKDNAQFGVRAVGADGFKSPAGFPFAG
ncbi:aminopeptidase [Lentinula raphanica]|nr:aminopeptidase [Lentinula raphanica]